MKLSIVDVRNRIRNIPGEVDLTRRNNFDSQAEAAIESGFISKITYCMECALADSSHSMSESSMYNLFDALCEKGNVSQINKYGNIIIKEYVNRSRDAKETQTYLKQKLGRVKGKMNLDNSIVNKNLNSISNAIQQSIDDIKSNLHNNLQPAASFVQSITPQNPSPDNASPKEEAALNAYEGMLEAATKLVAIDRILENYNRVSKRFNIDKIIQENTMVNGISDTAIEVAKLIETYDMPVKARYNTCLETMWYGLHKNSFSFEESELVTTITDYYMAIGENTVVCRSVLEGSVVFDKIDYGTDKDLDVILDDDEIIEEAKLSSKERKAIKDKDYGIPSKRKYPMPDESHVRSAIQMFNHCDKEDEAELAKNIKKKIRTYGMSVEVGPENRFSKYYSSKNEAFASEIAEDSIWEYSTYNCGYPIVEAKVNYKEIMNKYKTSNDADKPNKLKDIIRRLYAGRIEDSVDELPDFLKYIRGVFVVGGIAIHPIVGAIVFLGDQLLGMHMQREEAIKARNAFKAELKATDKKIESCKNSEEKKNLQEYRKSVYDVYQKLDQYYESLLNDEELDKKYDEDETIADTSIGDVNLDDDDFADFDFGDFDFNDEDFGDLDNFEEGARALKYVALIGALTERYDSMENTSFDQAKLHKIIELYPSIATSLLDVVKTSPEIISKDALSFAINDVKSDAKIGVTKLDYTDKYDLDNVYRNLGIMFDQNHKTSDIFEEAMRLTGKLQIIIGLNEMYESSMYKTPLTEASVLNSIKLASEKVRKGLQKLSDKDRTISKNIDVSANNFKKSAEKALTTNNREAVIKGSVIPSASKTIKLAIAAGGLALIDPAIAVIGILGYIGCTKSLQQKQRQQILDEIEIELKMCQKYIEVAESKNDLKALKKLYEIQRNLERQRGKVKYHMNLKGEKYYRKDRVSQSGVMDEM